ncbi:MAG: hypothetical protein KDJ15_03325 [Alphaproteobacteria bacterium]|nr:hypothetical protein [Alphaproteobacteria bacterium]
MMGPAYQTFGTLDASLDVQGQLLVSSHKETRFMFRFLHNTTYIILPKTKNHSPPKEGDLYTQALEALESESRLCYEIDNPSSPLRAHFQHAVKNPNDPMYAFLIGPYVTDFLQQREHKDDPLFPPKDLNDALGWWKTQTTEAQNGRALTFAAVEKLQKDHAKPLPPPPPPDSGVGHFFQAPLTSPFTPANPRRRYAPGGPRARRACPAGSRF